MTNKRTYRIENYSTGAVSYVTATTRKDAHEMSQAIWPGVTVEVCTEAEYYDREIFRAHQNQVFDLLEGIEASIPDSDYRAALRCLESIKLRVQELEIYFENQAASAAAGEGVISP